MHGKRRKPGPAGAGNPPDEQEDDAAPTGNVALADQIAQDQNPQIRHEEIEVPDHRNPFADDPVSESNFFEVLARVVEAEIVPAGYSLLPEEWEEDGYPDIEILTAGKQGETKIRMSLANPIWKQRAELWVQALNVLSRFNL